MPVEDSAPHHEAETGQAAPARRRGLFSRLSIRWRLIAYFALFVAVLLVLLWLFQIVFLESFYKSIKTGSIKNIASNIVASINDENFYSELNRLTRQDVICVHIINQEGATIYSSGNQSSCILHMMLPEQIRGLYRKAVLNGGTVLQNFVLRELGPGFQRKGGNQTASMEQMLYGVLVTKENGEVVMVTVDATITPINTTVETLRAQLVIITLIMAGFSLILVLILSAVIAKPLIRINKSAKQLATGDYTTHFEAGSFKEVSELADTLNYASTELSKVEHLRQEFIANVSHDLRTPLTMITGYAEVMRDLPDENTPENVQIIIDEAKRLTDLVNDILDLSRLQTGNQTPDFEPLALTAMIRGIMERYSKLILHEGYTVTLEAAEDVLVLGDELRMTQVLYNLINNAINYTGEDKKVIVRQTVHQNRVRIEVIDSGDGIPAESLPYIWDRYYKVDKTHKRSTVGSGLGLSIVKSVLDSHHANYGVESEVKHGSDFWFEMDLLEDAPSESEGNE